MTVILVVIVVSCVIGAARGGSLHNLSMLHLAAWPLVFVALAVQAFGAFAGLLGVPGASAFYVTGMVLSALLVTYFVYRNRTLPGMALVATGFLLNALVVAANGAMPVEPEAAERAGVSTVGLYRNVDSKHEIADENTLLRPLADIVAVPMPGPLRYGSNVVSIGDIVLAAGIGVLVVNAMLRVRSAPRSPSHVRK